VVATKRLQPLVQRIDLGGEAELDGEAMPNP